MYGYGYGSFSYISSGVAVDPDAQAFITAAAITDPTQQSAVNQLVLDLKSASIWTKMKAVYPFVGGSASSHKFNLKDPRDLDAAYRLVFNGGWTHSSNGITGNGINTNADSKLNASSTLNINSKQISVYLGNKMNNCAISAGSSGSFDQLLFTGGFYYTNISNNVEFYSGAAVNRFHLLTRTSSNLKKHYINGSVVNTVSTSSVSNTNNNYLIGAWNSGSWTSDNNFRLASIGDGLTDTEAENLYTIVQTFQTTLGRNV